jgi:hypothetical protein
MLSIIGTYYCDTRLDLGARYIGKIPLNCILLKTAKQHAKISSQMEVPEKYIVHKVSVQTLLERGLSMERYCKYSNNKRQPPPAYLLRQDIAKYILDPANGGYDIGMSLGSIAQCFRARAPVHGIAHRILSKCTQFCYVNRNAQNMRVSYWHSHETTLNFEHFYWIERGINEALFEFWLNHIDFCIAYKEHCEWVSRLEDKMERDLETFGVDIYYGDISYPKLYYQTREDKKRAEIEIAATKLGL